MSQRGGDPAMAGSDYDETRVVARLLYLDIEVLRRRLWQVGDEQM